MEKEFKPYQFIKLLRNTKDGATGTGLITEISKELETAYKTLLFQLNLVTSGGSKKGFLKAQRKLGQDEINLLKNAWSNLYLSSTDNVVVLNNGLEFQEASSSSTELELNVSKQTLQNEIENLFHIYSNDFNRTFKEAIYPIVKVFETALNRDLLLEKEKRNYFFEFDVKEIIRVSINERYSAYKLAKETGFMILNEIQKAENLEYVEVLDVVNVGLGAVLYLQLFPCENLLTPACMYLCFSLLTYCFVMLSCTDTCLVLIIPLIVFFIFFQQIYLNILSFFTS